MGIGHSLIARIRRDLGTAGFLVAVVAVVIALGGGAYAASGGLSGKQKKEVEKIAKRYAGKAGAIGPAGPTGAAGAKGDVGPEGKQGPEGKEGKQGPRGNPGQTGFTATLPGGETETGAWSLGITRGAEVNLMPLSLNIPLEAPAQVHLIDPNGEEVLESGTQASTVCLGTATEPTAAAGSLCLYATKYEGLIYSPFLNESFTTGASMGFAANAEGAYAAGTWAVTAP